MRVRSIVLTGIAGAMLFAAPAVAQMRPLVERPREPGAALGAAASNIVFAPVRFALTAVNAVAGGLTGFLTTNADRAADDIFGLTDGQSFLQPANIEGRRSVRVGELRFGR